MQLREAGLHGHKPDERFSIYSLEYYAEYVTMDANCKLHTGIRHTWNCVKEGFPSVANLRKFMSHHDQIAADAGIELITVMAFIRRVSNGEVVAETKL
jgi:predicted amino acid racemase